MKAIDKRIAKARAKRILREASQIAADARRSDPTRNLCECGHSMAEHYHNRGMCEGREGRGYPCFCSRFKRAKRPANH